MFIILFPDYFYPGKIIGTKVEVLGEPEEDKTVKFTIRLKSDSVQLDGASKAQARFTSSIGTSMMFGYIQKMDH